MMWPADIRAKLGTLLGPNQIETFLHRIDTSGGPDACWPWAGRLNATGYGGISFPHPSGGRRGPENRKRRATMGAHRVVWSALKGGGVLPSRFEFVCHSCDNPPCCNPAHLDLGTPRDNTQDCIQRGRRNFARGERARQAKLTREQIPEIREKRAAGATLETLGDEYGVTKQCIASIVTRRTWAWVA